MDAPGADYPFIWIDGQGSGASRLLFRNPLRVIRADRPEDVLAAFAALDAAVADGLYVAGYCSYEAVPIGRRFSEAARIEPRAESPDAPLLWFGVFRAPLDVPIAFEIESSGEYSFRPIDSGGANARAEFLSAVNAIRDWIAAGEVYQVNYTRATRYDFSGDPLALYRRLRRLQPAAHGAFVRHDDRAILSCSPELFLRMIRTDDGARLLTGPIKGTVARAADPAEDAGRIQALRDDAKCRAENAMIVDLLRNDLGRHALPGTVRVTDLFRVETLPTLHQLVSRVEARVSRSGRSAFFRDIWPALFPCGSITGAPRRAARLFIERLEGEGRGVYTGSIGWLGPKGGSFNVAIRTLQIDGDRARYGSGCGIVWDSTPEEEWREYELKGSFLVSAFDDFEIYVTGRLYRGRLVFVRDHHRRLRTAARRFHIPWSPAKLRAALAALDIDPGACDWRFRVSLNRRGEVRIDTSELSEPMSRGLRRVRIPAEPFAEAIDSGDPFRRYKTSRRELYNRGLQRALAAGFDEILFQNERGELVESAASNLLIKTADGRWRTPGVASGALPGIYLKRLMRSQNRRGGGAIEVGPILPDDVRAARAVLLCNAVRGLRRARLDRSAKLSSEPQ